MTMTYGAVLGAHDVTIPEHLEAEAEIPVITARPQAQGDLIVIPQRRSARKGEQVPPAGVPVIRGEVGRNTHLLVADGPVSWAPVTSPGSQDLGVVDVELGGTAYLLHPEHGASGIGPGSYLVRRQRQQADVVRTVAD